MSVDISEITSKHLGDNTVEVDSNIINSMIEEKRAEGNKLTREQAVGEMKKARTAKLIQEMGEKDGRSIDWNEENKDLEVSEDGGEDVDRDSVEVQEKEVGACEAVGRLAAVAEQDKDNHGAGNCGRDPAQLSKRRDEE